jgi:hypothetical protein
MCATDSVEYTWSACSMQPGKRDIERDWDIHDASRSASLIGHGTGQQASVPPTQHTERMMSSQFMDIGDNIIKIDGRTRW